MRSPRILVLDAPNYETFVARVIPGLGHIPARDDRGELAVVFADPDLGEPARAVPSRCVSSPQAVSYAEGWMTLTGRPLADIYIPESLR